MAKVETLPEGLVAEIKRNQELLDVYRKIPAGAFAATMISTEIKQALDALASGDAVTMLQVYQSLKGNK